MNCVKILSSVAFTDTCYVGECSIQIYVGDLSRFLRLFRDR